MIKSSIILANLEFKSRPTKVLSDLTCVYQVENLGKGIVDEIRAVEKLRMVSRDTIVAGGSLPVLEMVWGTTSGIRGDEVGERRRRIHFGAARLADRDET
ncbi:hypothetical protein FRC15_008222 [Serendipita sp. 397]|nr:hypothetical protein FRC15_008222 [Serendipita sp. 397]